MSKKVKLPLDEIQIKSFITNLTHEEIFNLKGRGTGSHPYSSSDYVHCETPQITVLAGIKGCETP